MSCADGLPKPPQIDYIYEVDIDTPACARFKVISQDPPVIKYDMDLPIESCNTMLAVDKKDGMAVKNFIEDAQDWASKNPKCFK